MTAWAPAHPLTPVTVVHERWRPHPLAWIHRAEAHAVAEELRRSGHAVERVRFHEGAVPAAPSGPLLLRLSDPVMLTAVSALARSGVGFLGPSAAVMARCYDKYEAWRIAEANGVDCPATALGEASALPFPVIVKPRRGSDSIGLRLVRRGPLPRAVRSDRHITQEYVHGTELTVAVLHGRAGMPLAIALPPGTPYSFARKYVLRPPRGPLTDVSAAQRAREAALNIAGIFAVNWAARVDLIYEPGSGRLRFIECDVAPLIGAGSAFAASLEAAGIARPEQLRLLLDASR